MKEKNRNLIFPFFEKNPDIVYLDSALTTPKPKSVIEKIINYYQNDAYSINRSDNFLSKKNLDYFNVAIANLKELINAGDGYLLPTPGVTNTLNQLARVLLSKMKKGDQIIIGRLEHASNFLPWLMEAKKRKIKIKYYDLDDDFSLDLEKLKKITNKKVKLLAISHISNNFGNINNLKAIKKILLKQAPKALMVVDGAQAIGHLPINLKEEKADFYLFGGHKMFAPQGIAFLYINKEIFDKLPVFDYGGGMNLDYDQEKIIYRPGIERFYAGNLNLGGVIAAGEAAKFLQDYKVEKIAKECKNLKDYLEEKIKEQFPKIKILNYQIGHSITLLGLEKVHPEDFCQFMQERKIIIRPGPSCVKAKNSKINLEQTVRISYHLYNNYEDIDKFINALKEAKKKWEEINNV